jgi:hypothetical protein
MGKKSEDTQTVIDSYNNDACAREINSVIDLDGAGSFYESTTVDINDHGQVRVRFGVRSPHIEIQAVFAYRTLDKELLCPGQEIPVHSLHATGAELRAVTNSGPFGWRHRRTPAKISDGRCGVGDAFERGYVRCVVDLAGNGTVGGLGNEAFCFHRQYNIQSNGNCQSGQFLHARSPSLFRREATLDHFSRCAEVEANGTAYLF